MPNFIHKMLVKDIIRVNADSKKNSKLRLQNISWPSEALASIGPFNVGECKRALFYKVIGAEPTEEMSLRGRYICDAGQLFEEFYIDRFKEDKLYFDSQTKIEFETNTANKVVIAGKIDVIIRDENVLKAIEIKSVSAFIAPDIFGTNGKLPLPSVSNLMQAMIYKYYCKHTEKGQASGIKEVYLMYVNRSDNSICFFEIDLDDEGYPIIRAIDKAGNTLYNMNLKDQKSYNELLASDKTATIEEGSIAKLRININDIFAKFDLVYEHSKNKILPEPDYKINFSAEDLEREVKCGRLTQRKLSMIKKSGESYSDYKCTICIFKRKCLADSGYIFN